MTGDIRDDRLAKNESLFREQNERIAPHNAVYVWVNPAFADWICECADEGCSVPVRLTVAEYEAVRAKPTQFLVAPIACRSGAVFAARRSRICAADHLVSGG